MLRPRPVPAGFTPALLAKYGDVLVPRSAPVTLAQGFQPRPTSDFQEAKFTVPVKPARFKVLKKGPRAGQSVPETMLVTLGIWTLSATDGTVYRFTSRSSKVTVTHPTRPDLKLSPDEFRATARRIWEPETAARAITFLLGAG